MHAFHLPSSQGEAGGCLAVLHAPQGAVRAAVLLAPPFLEELNKTRRMLAEQARAFAAQGAAVLRLDLTGCGDSAGELAHASWERWLDDLLAGARELRRRYPGVPLVLWGCRTGALLARQLCDRLDPAPAALLFWQPVAEGRQALQQFLRLKVAAAALVAPAAAAASPGEDGQTTDASQAAAAPGLMEALKASLARGETVTVAGYELPAAVAHGLAAATLAAPPAGPHPIGLQVGWLEVQARPGATPSPALQRVAQAWRQAGCPVELEVVPGPAFWQSTEIETAPALVQRSAEVLARWLPALAAAGAQGAGPGPIDTVPKTAPAATTVAPRVQERAWVFGAADQALLGVLSQPQGLDPAAPHTGVLVIVGGPQYRVGSHRQFVQLARALAAEGFPVLRFDVRGMGDSEGQPAGFEQQDADIAAALTAWKDRVPGLRSVVLFGLCDGASAALMYVQRQGPQGVAGLALLNPWVRSPQTHAATQVRHYYLQRLRSAEFWRKLLRGQVARGALAQWWASWRTMRAGEREAAAGRRAGRGGPAAAQPGWPSSLPDSTPFHQRMAVAWAAFPAPVFLLLSGQDYTAREFCEAVARQPAWQGAWQRPQLTRVDLERADHTLSDPRDSREAEAQLLRWLRAHQP